MAVFIYFEHLNSEAQLEINWNATSDKPLGESLPVIEEISPVTPTQPNQAPEHLAGDYSPVAIILATCALVTAIGKALRPRL